MRSEFMILCLLLSVMAMQTASIGVSAYVPRVGGSGAEPSPSRVNPPTSTHPGCGCGERCCGRGCC